VLHGVGALGGVDGEVLGSVVVAVDIEEARVVAGGVVDGRSTGGIVLGGAGQVCDGRPPVEGFGVDDG